MTQDWPVHTGYDPTWRSFKGKTAFAPHPSSLVTAEDADWLYLFDRTRLGAPPSVARGAPVVPYRLAEPAAAPSAAEGKTPPDVPVTSGDDAVRVPPRRAPPWAVRPVVVAGLVGVAAAAALAFVALPKLLQTGPTLKTVFTAPMLVLRAAGPGAVTKVSVSIGQSVDPATVLLTIQAAALSDAALNDLKTRLTQAQARLTGLDAPGAPPAVTRQKEAAAAEVEQVQKAIAAAGGSGSADQPIVAGVRGVVWSLDAQAGTKLKAGDPLVQLADCGRAFLVLPPGETDLKAGQTVLIRMPGVPPFHGTVRPSAGLAEPQDTLVINPTGFSAAAPKACPVGATAEVQPEAES